MDRPILNIADVEFRPWGHGVGMPGQNTMPGEQFGARLGPVGARIGAQKLGYGITAIPPGKRAFPRHNHHNNEEMFFILEGEGEIRIGQQTHPVRQGDIIACPPGGADTAHHIINTGAGELRFLAVSTMLTPEIVEYPDSGKIAAAKLDPPGPDGRPRGLRFIGRRAASLDYWDGE